MTWIDCNSLLQLTNPCPSDSVSIWNVGFWGEGKTNNKLNPHDAKSGNRTQATLVGGEDLHSSLHIAYLTVK